MAERPRRRDESIEALRVPPFSIQAEQAVLGGLMLDNQTWDKVADRLIEEDFYRRDHRLIFRGIRQLTEKRSPFDLVTLSEMLEKSGTLDDAGGLAYLGTLARDTPSAANIEAYADIVREKSVLRQLIHAGTEIADSGFQPETKDLSYLLEQAEQKVFQIADQQRRSGGGLQPIGKVMAAAMERIDALYKAREAVTGLSMGYTDLDLMTSGLQRSDLVIVAGRPSMGKTTLAMNIAENVALGSRVPVAVFSMEMSCEQLAMRMISSLGRVNQQRVRTGKLEEDDWPRVSSAINLLGETRMFIDDTPALTPTDARARCRRLAREHGTLGLVVIDYLQLMQSPGSENRVNEISDISRSLKALAKEMNCPVIALSQLNRSLEQRPNKRPMMSDLRESGAIEQDADVIVFIYRDEVYNPDSPDKGTAEIILAKQRNGPIGTTRLTFLGHNTRFENFAPNSDYGGMVAGVAQPPPEVPAPVPKPPPAPGFGPTSFPDPIFTDSSDSPF